MIYSNSMSPAITHEHDLLGILFDSMPVGIAIYNPDLTLQSFNSVWAGYVERYAHCERSRVVPGANLYELTPGIEKQTAPHFERALAGETVRLEGLRLESRGTVSYWDAVLCPLYEGDRVINVVEVTSDATERVLAYRTLEQRVEERTREIEKRRAVAESLGEMLSVLNSSREVAEILQCLVMQARQLLGANCVAFFDLDADTGLLTVQAFVGAPSERMSGYTLPLGVGAVGKAVLKRKPVLIADTRASLPAALAEHSSAEEEQLRDTIRHLVPYYRTAFALPLVMRDQTYGGIGLYYEQKRQFTEEDVKQAEMFAHQAVLAIENAHLRRQIAQAAVAAERNRIARDLHDSVTQTLFSANLIAEVLPRLWERDPAEARRRMEEVRQLTRGALAEMRMLLLELRPATLGNVPLGDLLKQLAEATGGRSHIPVTVIAGDCTHLPPAVHDALYRIAQEALNNIAKHSGATQGEATLRCGEGHIEMVITDNGRGFDSTEEGPSDHMGLHIMHERAREIGADCSVESRPGDGTRVVVTWQQVGQVGSGKWVVSSGEGAV